MKTGELLERAGAGRERLHREEGPDGRSPAAGLLAVDALHQERRVHGPVDARIRLGQEVVVGPGVGVAVLAEVEADQADDAPLE